MIGKWCKGGKSLKRNRFPTCSTVGFLSPPWQTIFMRNCVSTTIGVIILNNRMFSSISKKPRLSPDRCPTNLQSSFCTFQCGVRFISNLGLHCNLCVRCCKMRFHSQIFGVGNNLSPCNASIFFPCRPQGRAGMNAGRWPCPAKSWRVESEPGVDLFTRRSRRRL